MATSAFFASRINSSAIWPGKPVPISASSQPLVYSMSTNSSVDALDAGSLYFSVNVYSLVIFSPLLHEQAYVYSCQQHAELASVICRASRCAVNGCNAKLTTSTCLVVQWTVHFALSVATTNFYSPVMLFSILNSVFNFLFGVASASHYYCLSVAGCQLTTCLVF